MFYTRSVFFCSERSINYREDIVNQFYENVNVPFISLTILSSFPHESFRFFLDNTQVAYLEVCCDKISGNLLMKTLDGLKKLRFLNLINFHLYNGVVLSGIERILPKPIKPNDNVIHLIIDQISNFQQLIPVLQEFSSLRKVTLGNIRKMDPKSAVRFLLLTIKETNSIYVKNLSLFNCNAEYDEQEQLQSMIENENLIQTSFTIQRKLDRFEIQWN